MSLLAIVTTLPSLESARSLSRELVERHWVACAQIDSIESLYLWQGKLQQEPEFRLTLKATESRYEEIEAAILAHHPYDLPAIHAIRLTRVHRPYGDWIAAQNRSAEAEATDLDV